MSLSNPVLTGPGGGRTVESGHSSSAELKIAGEQSGGEWAVVEWRVRAGDEFLVEGTVALGLQADRVLAFHPQPGLS